MNRAGDATVGAVIVAAGSGLRFGNTAKVFLSLGGQPVLKHSVCMFLSIPEVQQVVVVLGAHTLEQGRALLCRTQHMKVSVCLGGDTRSDSVRAGVAALTDGIDLVAVHDAARPLARVEMVRRVIDAAQEHGAAAPVVPLSDTIARLGPDRVLERIEPRDMLGALQTPQVTRRDWLEMALHPGANFSDESGALLAVGFQVKAVDGSPDNIKLTWPEDLAIAEYILNKERL